MFFVGDPRPRVARRKSELIQCFEHFLEDGRYVLGSGVSSFEKAFSRYIDMPHCIGVANGTDALEIALKSLGVDSGDLVVTAPNAGGYATTAISSIGAVPHYVDVDPETFCMSLSSVVQSLTKQPKAVVVTHLYGRTAPDIDAIAELCRTRQVLLIEDCAQAHGSCLLGRHAGSFGDASCFSFYPTKNLGGLGDGGAICTSNPDVADRCYQLRQYGWDKKYHIGLPGGRNSRLDELQARFLELFLKDLEHENQLRRLVAARYRAYLLHPMLTIPFEPKDSRSHVYHLFVVKVAQGRDNLITYLQKNEIFADIHYPVPDHLQQVAFTSDSFSCPVAEGLAGQLLTLPCYPDLSPDQQDFIIDIVNHWSDSLVN